jgi:hypothetical protein
VWICRPIHELSPLPSASASLLFLPEPETARPNRLIIQRRQPVSTFCILQTYNSQHSCIFLAVGFSVGLASSYSPTSTLDYQSAPNMDSPARVDAGSTYAPSFPENVNRNSANATQRSAASVPEEEILWSSDPDLQTRSQQHATLKPKERILFPLDAELQHNIRQEKQLGNGRFARDPPLQSKGIVCCSLVSTTNHEGCAWMQIDNTENPCAPSCRNFVKTQAHKSGLPHKVAEALNPGDAAGDDPTEPASNHPSPAKLHNLGGEVCHDDNSKGSGLYGYCMGP